MIENIHLITGAYKFVRNYHYTLIEKKRAKILGEIKINTHMNDKILEKRLFECSLLSSHNSYLSNYQNFDSSDIGNIQFLIELGVRCLEFDVYYINGVLKVGHGTKNIKYDFLTTNLIKLEDIFILIKDKAFRDFSDMPLIINLELLTKGDREAHRKIAEKIRKYFYGYILHSKFENAKMNLGWVKLKHLRKKIIFITGDKLGENDPLAKYINAYSYKLCEIVKEVPENYILNLSDKQFYCNKKLVKEHIKKKGLVRIYPRASLMHHFSSNYYYNDMLKIGVQMCALNIQQMGQIAVDYIYDFDKNGGSIY